MPGVSNELHDSDESSCDHTAMVVNKHLAGLSDSVQHVSSHAMAIMRVLDHDQSERFVHNLAEATNEAREFAVGPCPDDDPILAPSTKVARSVLGTGPPFPPLFAVYPKNGAQ